MGRRAAMAVTDQEIERLPRAELERQIAFAAARVRVATKASLRKQAEARLRRLPARRDELLTEGRD